MKYAEQGQRLKELRGERSANSVAKEAGISGFYLHALEHGKSAPSALTVAKLLAVLGEKVKEINWPPAYDPISYNHRQPKNAGPGSAGERLKELRFAQPNKPSQAQVAAQLGITEQAYARIERGYTTKPASEIVLELAHLFASKEVLDWFE